ncbi:MULTISPECIES: hypothetical protein [unclassified Mucilaginibacter]|uniref:hypothetical protein n=3 Tax=Mucilaginibacter TaxID=423349 RepID=UPI002AC8EA52|nr:MULTISPECIES: hypothetical protein [unclassified Mucilaginibacter]MEB0262653.1 hypothetical protein [Mucilaginibacter sp. 10I4]MEB0280605.1 hypothetical protein [Mucilaginibacter sp. 10B2]WPX24977.1 hypothetical protein RHM67_06840 [Mucilaginibacter sp. 5C4]
MNQLQLYLNDELVDLADDSPVALTFQINNLAEVKNQQGNTSNQFKLPLTQRNRQILGFPDDVAFTTALPYNNYQAKIIQDGLEIVPSGLAILNNIEQDSAAITVLSGNVDFFDSLDVKIYDMGDSTTTIGKQGLFTPFDHTWDLATVVASQSNTSGWIWPVVDYGRIAPDFSNNPQVDVRYLRPGFFLKTAIDLFVKSAGYRINPHSFLLKQPLYDKLIVQFANDNFEHGGNTQNKPDEYGITAFVGSTRVINHNNVADNRGVLPFTDTTTDQHSQFNGYVYRAKQITTVNVEVRFQKFRLYGRVTGYPAYVVIRIAVKTAFGTVSANETNYDFSVWDTRDREKGNGGNIYGWHDFEPRNMAADVELTFGDEVSVEYEFFGNTHANFTLYSGSSLIIKSKDINVLYKQQVQCERIFPDITQKDLLKDTLQRFGIICQTDNTNRMVTFASFRDIVNNIPAAKNWTAKCLDQGKTVAFQLGGYAQMNTMEYKVDEAILPKAFGNAQITVADKTLPATGNLFESRFAPTLNRPYIGGSIAQILKVDTTSDINAIDFNIGTQPRLLIDQKLNLLNLSKQVTFTDGTTNIVNNDTIAVPYFYKPGQTDSLLWENLRIEYYPELEKILQQTKKVERFFMLTPRDILELDLLIPVYLEQDGAYYYINKIDSWRKGRPVKVELIKLG